MTRAEPVRRSLRALGLALMIGGLAGLAGMVGGGSAATVMMLCVLGAWLAGSLAILLEPRP